MPENSKTNHSDPPTGEEDTPVSMLARMGYWGVLLLFIWTILAVVEVILATVLRDTTLNVPTLPAAIRWTLLAEELSLLAVVVAVVGLPIAVLCELLSPHISDRGVLKWFARGVTVAVVFGWLMIWASSWAVFQATGNFTDAESLRFAAQDSVQFFQHVAHMEPYVLVLVPAAVVVVAAGVSFVLPWLIRRSSRRVITISRAVCGALAALCVVGALVGPRLTTTNVTPVADPAFGMVYVLGDLYACCRDDRTGPAMHLMADLRRAWSDEDAPALADSNLPVDLKPIISFDEYAGRVDKKAFKRWNVIVILVESLRPDQLRLCGGVREVMPAVESLGRHAMVFRNCYTQSSHSNYADLCPLSSLYPLWSPRPHVYAKHPTYPRVMLYDILKRLGYRTAVISSQNEHWGGMANVLQTPGLDHFFHSQTFDGPTYVPRYDEGFTSFIKGSKRSGKIDDRFTVSEAIRWIDSDDAPFFVYMNLQNSHVPFETPADFPHKFGPEKLPFTIRFNNFPRSQRAVVMDVYADSLAYVDHQLSRLMEHLKRRNLWDKTIIVLSGDTGQAFYEHGFAAHANMLFNEVMRVPLIIHAPNLAGGASDQLAQHVDVPPTVLALLNLPEHPSFQGLNLLDANIPKDRSVFLVVQSPLARQYAIVRDGYKLIYDARRRRRFLFDLRRDSGETKPVNDLHPGLVDNLSMRLDTWRKLQMDYYRRLSVHTRYYPPVLKD